MRDQSSRARIMMRMTDTSMFGILTSLHAQPARRTPIQFHLDLKHFAAKFLRYTNIEQKQICIIDTHAVTAAQFGGTFIIIRWNQIFGKCRQSAMYGVTYFIKPYFRLPLTRIQYVFDMFAWSRRPRRRRRRYVTTEYNRFCTCKHSAPSTLNKFRVERRTQMLSQSFRPPRTLNVMKRLTWIELPGCLFRNINTITCGNWRQTTHLSQYSWLVAANVMRFAFGMTFDLCAGA